MLPTSIGSFRIIRELGRGGMGVVYLATDTRLDRQVAIKTLPEHLSADPDRLARFQREAKVLASLNHPSIAAIYGLEEVGGARYLVLEFVDGHSLAERLKSGPVPVDEALMLAKQIAEALEAAHDKGVVHRDLKPGNIMVNSDGHAKVLDFGLARTSDGLPSSTAFPLPHNSPTLTQLPAAHSPTIPGAIMGTAGYMSPEQARGKPVDKRSDIFSFGCVLFEMLTGQQPFTGETFADSLGATLHKDLDFAMLPPGTPASVQLLIRRCVAKDRSKRLHDIADARIELEHAIADPSATALLPTGAYAPTAGTASRLSRRAQWALVAVIALLAAGVAWLWATRAAAPPPAQEVRFELDAPKGYGFPHLGEGYPALCLNPAGDKLVFGAESEGTTGLFLRELSSLEAKPIPGTEGAEAPFFSPDGRWLAYFAHGHLMKLPVAGGPALTICTAPPSAGAWLSDGTIALGSSEGLRTVKDSGGTLTLLSATGPTVKTSDGAQLVLGFNRIEAVPGASYLLACAWDGDTLEDYSVVAVSLKDGSMRSVIRKATDARFIAPDRLLFLRGSAVLAVPFDPTRGVVTGEPVQVIDGVRANRWSDAGAFTVSPNGTLAYMPGGRPGPGRRLVRLSPAGKSTPLLDGVDCFVGGLRTSPDGRDLTVVTLRDRMQLWTLNLERRSLTHVSSEGETWSPVWTPDGSSIIHSRTLPGEPHDLVRRPARGNGPPERLIARGADEVYPTDVSPDGTVMLATARTASVATNSDVTLLRLKESASPAGVDLLPIVMGPSNDSSAFFAPDGKHFAFVSNESGRSEVYLRALEGDGAKVQVSTAGGNEPRWSYDGGHLYFLDRQDVMMDAAVDGTAAPGTLRLLPPVRLFDTKGVATTSVWDTYAVLPGGDFVMVEPALWETLPSRIRVVLNWNELSGKR